ncbi:hypothetical protein SLS58_008262 [Diplodia intermedia]|uniref:Adhesin domain-containing protein n=1 Tax=Diplodia intermedia TaxID=856260 RepID=A0ABR3THS9_9PEZI
MPTPHRSPSRKARVSDESDESTPLLGSPLPPPAYPNIVPHDSKDTAAAGPSRNQADYDQGPSKDLENAGVHPAAVHLHHRPRRPWSRGKILRLLFIAAAHAILIWLILSVTVGRAKRKSHVNHDQPNLEEPSTPYYCHELSHTHTTAHDFTDLAEFRIVEQIRQHHQGFHDIHGLIKIVAATTDDDKIRATVTVSSNFPDHDSITVAKTDTSLILQSTKSESPNTWHSLHDCTVVDVVVAVPPATRLDTLDVSANWLSLDLHSLLNLTLDDSLNVELGAGSVVSRTQTLRSRRTYISPAYGSVQGIFALLDLLEIDAAAGSVDVDVVPGEAELERPDVPAVFNARSKAGTISARFPTDGEGLPDRDYRVSVETEAGSIMGSYVHGSTSEFRSKYGSIVVKVLPFLRAGKESASSVLRTKNEAGPSMLDLSAPLESKTRGESPFANLTAEFTSSVGSVRAVFPPAWEGAADVDTEVGSLRVAGEDLDVVEEGTHGPVGKWVHAVKGEGDSTVLVKSKVGSVEFLVQETV